MLDVFHRHDPLQAGCLSVYDGVVNDLLRYMSHRDTEQELQQYVHGVLYMHGKKSVRLPDGLVAELLSVRVSGRSSVDG
jgi:hypothetical protein